MNSEGAEELEEIHSGAGGRPAVGGIAGWLLARWRGVRRREPRLALLERIALAPRQSLALVEADGKRFLVATSAEGGPAFYPLDRQAPRDTRSRRPQVAQRVSW